MRKLLIALALSITSAAYAEPGPKLSLTHPLIGNWCRSAFINGYPDKLPKTDEWPSWERKHNDFKRGNCPDRMGNVRIWQNGFAEDGHTHCEFRRMTSIPDGFKVFAECHTGTEIRWETATIRLSGKKLYFNSEVTDRVDHFRYPNFYQCIIVDDTSDGYLNLRTGPGSTYEVIAKLVKLDELQIDAEFNGWAHVIKVDRLPDLQGWVYRKHTFDDPSRPNCTCPEEGKDAGDPECTKFRDTIQEYAR